MSASKSSGFVIDGQRRQRVEPMPPITFLDVLGVPQPLVDDATEADFVEAGGGWIPTQPMPLEGDA